MPRNNEYDYDDDDEFEDESQNAPKDLRRALSKANKQLAELAKQNEELNKKLASQSLSSLMSEKKIPANIQRWMKRDGVEPTAEAVDKWLEENGSDFGWKPEGEVQEPQAQETQQAQAPAQQGVLSPEDAAQLQRLQAMGQAPADPPAIDPMKAVVDQVANSINIDTDFDAVARALKAAGIPIESQMSF